MPLMSASGGMWLTCQANTVEGRAHAWEEVESHQQRSMRKRVDAGALYLCDCPHRAQRGGLNVVALPQHPRQPKVRHLRSQISFFQSN